MKLVKNFVFAVLLASVLAVSAPAGEVDVPGYIGCQPPASCPSPTPPGTSGTDEAKNAFYGDPNATLNSAETSDYLFFEALVALLSVY